MTQPVRRLPWIVAAALAALPLATDGIAQAAPSENRSQSTAPPRRIAPVMSYQHADWLVRPERQAEEQPDRLIRALKIPRGATVVDLGAGVGYFTWRLAKRVGPTGTVIATDIQPEMIELLRSNLRERGIRNVQTVLARQDDAGLPESAADLVLLVDVYHELSQPLRTMRAVRRSLKPRGRLVLVEYRKEDPSIPIHPLHKMTVEQVRAEVEPAGFAFVELLNFLPSQHVVVFTPDGG